MIKLENHGAAFFDTDGLTLLPTQRNLFPFPTLSVDGGAGMAKGWVSSDYGTVTGTKSIVGGKQRLTITGAPAANASFGIKVDLPTPAGILRVGDVVAGAINVEVVAPLVNCRFEFLTYDQDLRSVFTAITTWSHRLKALNAPPLTVAVTSLMIYVQLVTTAANPTGTVDLSLGQVTRNFTWLLQGDKPYLTPMALEGQTGCVAQNDGTIIRRDGYAQMSNALVNLDQTKAWWRAVEFVPSWKWDEYAKADRDLMNFYPYASNISASVLSQMSLFRKNIGTFDNDPYAGIITKAYIWSRWDNSDTPITDTPGTYVICPNDNAGLEFVAGDKIRAISAYLPDGGAGIAAGKHVWVQVLDSAGNVKTATQHAYRPDVGYHASQATTCDRMSLGFWLDTNQGDWNNIDDPEWATNGKFRNWYVQQGAISQAMVDAYMADSASLGILRNGLYFPLDAGRQLNGYGSSERPAVARTATSRMAITRVAANRQSIG